METSIIREIDKQLVIMVYTDDTGDIPHFHIIDKETSGNTFHACVKIAQAQYFHHTGKENVLDSTQQESLVKFLTSECDLGISYWQFLLMTWNTNNANNKVNIDYNMPDYTSIENS